MNRRGLVLIGAFGIGEVCQALPNTVAGFACGLCAAFLTGVAGARLLDRWSGKAGE